MTMTKRTDRHSQVARELVVLSHSMDAVARGLQSLGGEAELKAAELRGAALLDTRPLRGNGIAATL